MNNGKSKVIISLKKTRSLLDKLITMVEKDEYCIDVMQQSLAAIGLLRSAQQTLMKNHLNTCFTAAVSAKNGKKKQQMIDEILTVTQLANK